MSKTVSPSSSEYEAALVVVGLLTVEEVTHASQIAQQTSTSLDEVLLRGRLVTKEQLARVQQLLTPATTVAIAGLDNEVIDPLLVKGHSGAYFRSNGWLPLRRLENGAVLAVTAREATDDLWEKASTLLGAPVCFQTTTDWAINDALLNLYGTEISWDASYALHDGSPNLSAREVLSKPQKVIGITLLGLLITVVNINPILSLVVFLAVLACSFFGSILYKFYISSLGSKHDSMERITEVDVAALTDEELPMYTVLVPVYREENIIDHLVNNLGAIDYPAEKLEILILTEEEDQLTRDAIARLNPPAHFHVITVPAGAPQTKPRACNVGLYFASGDFLVIYDAEDKPEPDQLKKAVIAFRKGEADLVCVQAALNYFNDDENFLTRMFTLEYSFWFDYMLTGLETARMPIPLGGTSNHFKTDMLRKLGGWDAWNVTEDADLGIRASALGYTVGTINSTTMEEANTSIPNFLRQRSRWIKGYMQTTLVHLRQPMKLVRSAGLKQTFGFLFLIGGTPACFLAVLPLYLVTLITFFMDRQLLTQFMPAWVLVLCLMNFFIGNALMMHISMVGPFKRRRWHLVLWALLNPVYWLLHSIAAYKALWQLMRNPHYWEKTDHGLTKMSQNFLASTDLRAAS